MIPKIILVIGILGVLLGLVVTGVSIALPALTRNVSSSEAVIGIIAGIVVLVLSFPIAVGGLIFVIKGRKTA